MAERKKESEPEERLEERFDIKNREDWNELANILKRGEALYFRFQLDDEGNLTKKTFFKDLVGKVTTLAAEQMIDLDLSIYHDSLIIETVSLKMQKRFQ